MRKPVSTLFVFLVILAAGVFGLTASSEAVKDTNVYEGSSGSGGAGGDDSGLPFENEAEAVADAVADAVSCVIDAFASILQDAKDLMATLWSLEETILSLISEAAQSVADLYLDYKTFLIDALGRTVSDLGTKLLEAQGLLDKAKPSSSIQGSGSTLSQQAEAAPGTRQNQSQAISPSASTTVGINSTTDQSADSEEIEKALESGFRRIQDLEREVLHILKVNLDRIVDDAVNMIKAKLEAAVELAKEILVTPIRIYWNTLKMFYDNPCDFLNPIGTAETILSQVNDQMDGMVAAIAAIRNDVPGAFDDAETPIQLAESNAEAAGRIVDRMRTLLSTKDRGSLNALNETIAASRSMVRADGGKYEMTKAMALAGSPPAVDRSTSDAIRLTRKIQGRVSHMENRMRDSARTALASKQRLSSSLDRIFLNRSPQEAETAKASILNKIRIKHGSNNKLLSDAKSFLDREVASRSRTARHPSAGRKTVAPAPRPTVPVVRNITSFRLPLIRGGTAQTVTVTGTSLDKVTVQVVKGRRLVSDVTTSVRRISPTSFKVTLEAPSTFQATGDDYYLRIVSGKRVIKQIKFTVKASETQTPSRPMTRPTPRSIQR